jgi:hypothetical protein
LSQAAKLIALTTAVPRYILYQDEVAGAVGRKIEGEGAVPISGERLSSNPSGESPKRNTKGE